DWDYWPDGDFEQDFDWHTVARFDDLMVHWAYRGNMKPDRKNAQSVDADDWHNGRVYQRRCLGHIRCTNGDCPMIVRPVTGGTDAIYKQTLSKCHCGAPLEYVACSIISVLYKWRGGIHYVNGPLKLLTGLPGVDGPRDSVADISDILVNLDRIRYERKKVKGKTQMFQSPDGFLHEFTAFQKAYPGFVIWNTIGDPTVIVLQSDYMRSLLVKNFIAADPDNGLLSDAAHKFWRMREYILIGTTTFATDMQCWVPVLFTFANGQTTTHYQYHFLALFNSIAKECFDRHITITDEMLAQVMDYGEAQRIGFIEGFVEFWMKQPEDHRTEDELRAKAKQLLKGCHEHFRASVTRIK
ncbi:hypothetical protein OE88DRAFT_1615346, partial [Heliocybe sulcata]